MSSGGSRYLGLNDFVEELARVLLRAPLRESYPSRDALVQEVAGVFRSFLKDLLGPVGLSFEVWEGVAETGEQGIVPVEAFGGTFLADLVVDVAGRPTVALLVEPVDSPQEATQRVGGALGQAFILAHRYPSVLLFFYSPSGAVRVQDLIDREITMDLWSLHKVKVISR